MDWIVITAGGLEHITAPTDMAGAFGVFLQVLMIDLILAGDNAVAVGMAAAALPADQRKKVIFWGIFAALVMRIAMALVATQLLAIPGLLFVGGLLLFYVAYKMWREMRAASNKDEAHIPPAKSWQMAMRQVLIADLSMSLDNVLGVAAAARHYPVILALGLILSVVFMGFAAGFIASALQKHRWIAWVGLAVLIYVAGQMVFSGWVDIAKWPESEHLTAAPVG